MNDLVFTHENQLLTTSKRIAEVFCKPHKQVLDAVRRMDCSEKFSKANFVHAEYKTGRGRTYECYNITEAGALFLCAGFTGKKAARSKEQLVNMVGESIAINKAIEMIESLDVDDPDMFVYIAQEAESGRYKIGISKDPEKRVKQLNTGNPEELVLIYTAKAEDGFKSESSLHRQLQSSNIRSEWFSDIKGLELDFK